MSKSRRTKRDRAIEELVKVAGASSEHAIREQARDMSAREIHQVMLTLVHEYGSVAAHKAIAKGDYITCQKTMDHPYSYQPWWTRWCAGVFGDWQIRFKWSWPPLSLYQWVRHVSPSERTTWHGWARMVIFHKRKVVLTR